VGSLRTIEEVFSYLSLRGIIVEQVKPKPSFVDFGNEIDGEAIDWLPYAKQTDDKLTLSSIAAESMSLVSMFAVTQLDAKPGMKVIDVCSAPGMKGLYLNKLVPGLDYYANDLSTRRLARLINLLKHHNVPISAVTKYDARFIDRAYEPESFDRILIDAPCSGEGVILGGSAKLLETWSPAKVKRLQQLQIGILKSSWKLLKPGGRLVYATCTLNKNENERVIKKALGIQVDVVESPLLTNTPETKYDIAEHTIFRQLLKNGMSIRILPSINSIGFFVAVLEKTADID
jgi:16S rRNA (cytosine967-C5)-methyltransferase